MESPAGLKIPVGLLHLVLLGSQQLQPCDSADDHDDADDLRRSQDFMIHKHAAERCPDDSHSCPQGISRPEREFFHVSSMA